MDERTTDARPWAQRMQTVSGPEDARLTKLAQARHRLAQWWWGQRQTPDGFGAYCYLCDKLIVTWDRRWPMTMEAMRAVMEHRRQHLAPRADAIVAEGVANARRAEVRRQRAIAERRSHSLWEG